jgi:hypothetical protein
MSFISGLAPFPYQDHCRSLTQAEEVGDLFNAIDQIEDLLMNFFLTVPKRAELETKRLIYQMQLIRTDDVEKTLEDLEEAQIPDRKAVRWYDIAYIWHCTFSAWQTPAENYSYHITEAQKRLASISILEVYAHPSELFKGVYHLSCLRIANKTGMIDWHHNAALYWLRPYYADYWRWQADLYYAVALCQYGPISVDSTPFDDFIINEKIPLTDEFWFYYYKARALEVLRQRSDMANITAFVHIDPKMLEAKKKALELLIDFEDTNHTDATEQSVILNNITTIST